MPWNRPRRPRGAVEVWLYSFFNLGTRCGWTVNATPRPIYPRERRGTHCIRGWAGLRAGLYRCRKSLPHRDSIPGPSSPYRVAISTALSRPTYACIYVYIIYKLAVSPLVEILKIKLSSGRTCDKTYQKFVIFISSACNNLFGL